MKILQHGLVLTVVSVMVLNQTTGQSARIGINTDQPAATLHVQRTGSSGAGIHPLTVAVFESDTHAYVQLLSNLEHETGLFFGTPLNGIEGGLVYNNAWTPHGMQFRTNDNLAKMTITQSGLVGIGTVTPESLLEVKNWNGNASLQITSMDGDTTSLRILEGLGFGFEFQYDGIADLLHLWSRKFNGNEAIRMTWDKYGHVGLGTTTPQALLHGADGAFLFSAQDTALNAANPPASGAGTRLMWYPDKAAFRVGAVHLTQWDKDSIGYYSFAAGRNNKATGNHAVALGSFGTASGNYAIALGQSYAVGYYALSGGVGSYAIGHTSTAFGNGNKAIGGASFATGYSSEARAGLSTTFGLQTVATGYSAMVIGVYNDTIVSTQTSLDATTPLFTIGNGDPGTPSNAMVVRKDGKVGVGMSEPLFDVHVGNGTLTAINTSDTRVAVTDNENGHRATFLGLSRTNSGSRVEAQLEANGSNNAGPSVIMGAASGHPVYLRTGNLTRMTITADGNVGIGTSTPSVRLQVQGDICYTGSVGACSDRRYKKDLMPLGTVMPALMQLGSYSYHWRGDAYPERAFSDELQIGVIAQEVQALFPELVLADQDGFLSVDYSRLSVILLAAVKEQQNVIEQLETLSSAQQQLISALDSRIRAVEHVLVNTTHGSQTDLKSDIMR